MRCPVLKYLAAIFFFFTPIYPAVIPGAFAYGVVIKHVDMDKLKQYKDCLTPEQYKEVLDRANEVERMIKDGPPRMGNEYDNAIKQVEDQAKQMAQESKDLLSQTEQTVTQELSRLERDYETYGNGLSESQRKSFLSQAATLEARWADPSWDSKPVNQALVDSNQMLSDIRKVSNNLVNMTPISPTSLPNSVPGPRRPPTFIGAPLDQEPIPLERTGFMDPDEIVPNSSYSYRNTPFVAPKLTADTISKMLSDLRLHLDGLNKINVIGSLEYESFSKRLNDLATQSERLKASDKLDDGRFALLQTLQNKINDLRRSIYNAATR